MKIAIDARLYGLENAGLGRYLMNLIDNLKEIDKENNYIVLLRKNYYDSLVLPDNWKKVPADFRHYSFGEQLLLPLILYKLWPDLVHFPHFNVPPLYCRKFVVTIHDLIMHAFVSEEATALPKFLYKIKRFGYNLIFSHAIKKSSSIIVPTNEVKKEVQKYYPTVNVEKIYCSYEGVTPLQSTNKDLRGVREKYGIQGPYFIYFGNAYPHKNLPFLINGIKELNGNEKKAQLFVSTPRGVFARRLEKMIDESGARGHVVFPGFVGDDDLADLLIGSIGFVYPSLLEGFGLQGLEALSSGTLVLASDISVFREVYQKSVIYFDPLKLPSLVAMLDRALKMGQNERDEWIRQGEEFVKSYSWGKMASETLAVYEKSCNRL